MKLLVFVVIVKV